MAPIFASRPEEISEAQLKKLNQNIVFATASLALLNDGIDNLDLVIVFTARLWGGNTVSPC